MAEGRRVCIRFSETDFRKIEAMRGDKTLTAFFHGLIKVAAEKEKQEASSFLELVKRLDSLDLSKVARAVERIEQKISDDSTAQAIERINEKLKENTDGGSSDIEDLLLRVLEIAGRQYLLSVLSLKQVAGESFAKGSDTAAKEKAIDFLDKMKIPAGLL